MGDAPAKPTGINSQQLAGIANGNGKRDKVSSDQVFPVNSLNDVLAAIRRTGGTGKLEINFKNGQARGEAKWKGFQQSEGS